eukprot:TRINITY_DN16283_c0_g1_i1.p1 TRINITY_DN16283_c0_g1~~TRINITY_DN16283_c0_g1_i1.p1  ORF type:complete len:1042 (+),score=358.36 TRINITY_DN16283_c0_g1_i1:133-3126(+)
MAAGAAAAPPVPSSAEGYIDHMLAQTEEGSGLLIAAAGLGVHEVAARLCFQHIAAGSDGLVLLMNATEECEVYVDDWLLDHGVDAETALAKLHLDIKPKVREATYRSARICAVNSKYLIVDILGDRIDYSLLRGCVVWHAHSLESEDAPEAFALRMLREKAGDGFWVRALTDAPGDFVRRGVKLEPLLRGLTVPRVWLWPRFHVKVEAALQAAAPEVVEIQQPMPRSMKALQETLLAVIGEVVQEVRYRLEKYLPAGSGAQDFTAAGAVSGQLHRFIREELSCRMEKLTDETHTLLAEIQTLKGLLRSLHATTAVEFNEKVEEATFAAEKQCDPVTLNPRPASWLLASATRNLLPQAKARLFKPDPETGVPRLHPEPDPKFAALREVMNDIVSDWRAAGVGFSSLEPGATFSAAERPTVLVLVKDARSRFLVSNMLQAGEQAVVQRMLREYVHVNYTVSHAAASQMTELHPTPAPGSGGGAPPPTPKPSPSWPALRRDLVAMLDADADAAPARAMDVDVDEGDAIDEATLPTQSLLTLDGEDEEEQGVEVFLDIAPGSEGSGGEESDGSASPRSPDDAPPIKRRKVDPAPAAPAPPPRPFKGTVPRPARETPATCRERLQDEFDRHFGVFGAGTGPQVVVHPAHECTAAIRALKPTWIIMYDNHLASIRRIETYAALHREWSTRVYVLGYIDSTDEHRCFSDMVYEGNAFKSLARARAALPDLSAVAKPAAAPEAGGAGGVPPPKSRRAGGLLRRLLTHTGGKVLVDIREFRSGLPSAIHRHGLIPVPLRLDVADYVLSPDVGVERKSIPDLVQSLASGHLDQQIVRLTKKYAVPVLLIEFDPRTKFTLREGEAWHKDAWRKKARRANAGERRQSDEDTPEAKVQRILKDVTSYVAQHPSLRIWWSRDPSMTAELFLDAKRRRAEPDPAYAGEETNPAEVAMKMLLAMPGVTSHNVATLVRQYDTLQALARATQEELLSVIGPAGTLLYTFLQGCGA